MSSSAVKVVKNLKNSLSKAMSSMESDADGPDHVERVKDILERLEECDVTLQILTETVIGIEVSKLKSHDVLGPRAKALIKKWKQVAKKGNSNGSSKKPPSASDEDKKAKKKQDSEGGEEEKAERRESTASGGSANSDAGGGTYTPESEWIGLLPMRQNICKKLYEIMELSKSALVKSGINATAAERLTGPRAAEIERAVYEKNFGNNKAYADKARSLAFNLKKNSELVQQVLLGQVPAENLATMSSEELASAETRQQRAKAAKSLNDSKRLDWEQANEAKINEMCGIKGDLLAASLFTCGRCKSTKTTSTQKQTRSADEPMTVFVLCLNCGNRWKC